MPEVAPNSDLIDGVDLLSRVLQRPRLTILRWLREGRVPAPDVTASRQARYWRRESLEQWLAARSAN